MELLIAKLGIIFLITFGIVLVTRLVRRHLVQWITIRWMFMYSYYLDRNPMIENEMGEAEVDKYYHMIGWDRNFMAWWRWSPRAMAFDKGMFDKVFTYYKMFPPEKAWK